jgi:hypothetical protein
MLLRRKYLFFVIAVLCIACSFIIPRIGIWKFFMFPLITFDSLHYFNISQQISQGILPSFHFIGAGYPVIIFLLRTIFNSANSIILFQQFFTLFSVVYFIYAVRKYPKYYIASIVFGCIYLMSDSVIKYEIAVFPDSIISNLLLILVALFFQSINSYKIRNIIFMALISVLLISIRSSSVFMIVVILLVAFYFWIKKESKKANLLILTFVGGLLLLSTYNFFFSEGNKFSFLTYQRLETRNTKDLLKVNLSETEKSFILKVYETLPDSTDIWKRYFSWDANEITLGILHTRTDIRASVINVDTFKICNEGDVGYTQCLQVHNQWRNDIQTSNLVEVINGDPYYESYLRKKVRRLYAYFGNIWLNFDQAYYSMIPTAYQRSQTNINFLTQEAAQTKEEEDLLRYAWCEHYQQIDDIGFEKRYAALTDNVPFKIYDIYNENISKKLIRTPFILILTFIAFVSYIIWFFRRKVDTKIVFLIFAGILLIGSAFTFTFFGNPLPRYSFDTEFIYFLISIFYLTDIIVFLFKKYIVHLKSNHAE